MSRQQKVNRRQFLRLSAAGAVSLSSGIGLSAPTVSAQDLPEGTGESVFTPLSRPGHLVRVVHSGALSDPARVNSAPVPEVIEFMVDTALLAFTAKGDVAGAWRDIIHPSDRVLMKLSCLGSPNMATNEAVAAAVIKGLQAAGVPNENMVLYDQYRNKMMRAHFRPGGDLLGVPIEYNRNRGYCDSAVDHGAGSSTFAVALEWATAVISLPVFKDHDLSGFTGGMKNISHGCIENPSRMHRRHCTAIADLFNTEMIRSRMRLVVVDGLRLMYDQGPQDNGLKEIHNSIYVATDPVAMDTMGLDLVNQARARHSLGTLAEDGRPNTYLARAAEFGIGIHDRAEITLEEHTLA